MIGNRAITHLVGWLLAVASGLCFAGALGAVWWLVRDSRRDR